MRWRKSNFPSNICRTSIIENICSNLNFRIWILKSSPVCSHSLILILVVLFFSNSFLLSLLLFSMSLYNRRNSDSEDEDLCSTIFSRIQKEQCRLDGNCQRSSLLLELATQQAIKSRDTHTARRSSGVSEEPRCSYPPESAWGSSLRYLLLRISATLTWDLTMLNLGNLIYLVQKHNI